MNINCVICREVFGAACHVSATGCGHLFHYGCLKRWFERSKSCPQCRYKATEETIHRVYFNFASNELEEENSVLRKKIASLEFQIHLKDRDVKNVTEENHTLNSQNKELREEIKMLAFRIRSHESEISALNRQIMHLKAENREATEAAKKPNQQLDTLKREWQAISCHMQHLREWLRKCQLDLSEANLEKGKLNEELYLNSKLNKKLEDDLQHLNHEKRSLQKKVCDLEKAISSPSGRNPRDSVRQRLLLKRTKPETVRRPKLTDRADGNSFMSTMFGNLLSSESKPNCQSEPQSAYLNMKSCSVRLTRLKGYQSVTQSLPLPVINSAHQQITLHINGF